MANKYTVQKSAYFSSREAYVVEVTREEDGSFDKTFVVEQFGEPGNRLDLWGIGSGLPLQEAIELRNLLNDVIDDLSGEEVIADG